VKVDRLFSTMLGGVPAVLLVVALGPHPSTAVGLAIWFAALVVIGLAGTGLLYNLLQAFRSYR
jgi:hypothetical protein